MGLFADIASDYRGYRRPLLAQGFWATTNHRIYSKLRAVSPPPLLPVVKGCHILSIKWCEVFLGIYIGPHARIGNSFIIEHFGAIIVHSETVIGDRVRIRQGVTIGNKSAAMPLDAPVIGDDVDVGAGAKILGAIYVGNGCVIGANAVVAKNIPPHAIAVGIPARLLRTRPKLASVAVSATSSGITLDSHL
jgi:serine O-acetyltransferase